MQPMTTYLREDSVTDSCVSLGEGLFPVSRGSKSQDFSDNCRLSNFCAAGLFCASGADSIFSDDVDSANEEDCFFSLFDSVPSSSLTEMLKEFLNSLYHACKISTSDNCRLSLFRNLISSKINEFCFLLSRFSLFEILLFLR